MDEIEKKLVGRASHIELMKLVREVNTKTLDHVQVEKVGSQWYVIFRSPFEREKRVFYNSINKLIEDLRLKLSFSRMMQFIDDHSHPFDP